MEATATQRVAANLRAVVARQRMPQALIAEAMGMSQQGVSRRMLGHVAINVDELDRFAEVLGVTTGSLLGETAAAS